ncbi:hypothetical protein AB0C40_34340 [Streptomyces brevispora]|uniref:hypothetical protein n=1 Tax=Streptomyces brevispora TaxID=887462 RepID=UPI0033DC9CAA
MLGIRGFAADPLTGLRPVPHAATAGRLLQRADGDALDAAISAFLQASTLPWSSRMIAVDGKEVRGSRTATAPAIQLRAAMDHHGVVLAQRQVASKSNRIATFAPLLPWLNSLELEKHGGDHRRTAHPARPRGLPDQSRRCPCRNPHPRMSCGMLVLVAEDFKSSETVVTL